MLAVVGNMFRQRVAGNCLLRCIGQLKVSCDILNFLAIVHSGEEELFGVAEDDGANTRVLKAAVLLQYRNDPGRELGELCVELTDEPLAAWNAIIEKRAEPLSDDILDRYYYDALRRSFSKASKPTTRRAN
jgi:hypothetical protein